MSSARECNLDLNNGRVRQLIEQFNAEEAYNSALHSAIEELRKLFASDADLAEAIAALRKWRSILPRSPRHSSLVTHHFFSSPITRHFPPFPSSLITSHSSLLRRRP
jgi:hypothetical protein